MAIDLDDLAKLSAGVPLAASCLPLTQVTADSNPKRFDLDTKLPSGDSVWSGPTRLHNANAIHTHPLSIYTNQLTSEQIILKGGPAHTLRAELATQRLMAHAGLNVPHMELITQNGSLFIGIEYRNEYQFGMKFPVEHTHNTHLQKGFLISLLTFDYDRTTWNLGFKKTDETQKSEIRESDEVLLIDFGGSMGSRAQGGYNGFPVNVDLDQIKMIIENPQIHGAFSNPAYGTFLNYDAIRQGKIQTSDTPLCERMVQELKAIPDEFIDQVMQEAFGDIDKQQSVLDLTNRCLKLKNRTDKKSITALETFQIILDEPWNGDQQKYFSFALKSRRDQIVKIFESALSSQK